MSYARLVAFLLVLGTALLAATAPPASAMDKMISGFRDVDGVSQFPLYKKLGADYYFTDLSWDQIARTRPANPTDPNDPVYNWTAADYEVAEAEKNGMKVMFFITNGASWANGGRPAAGFPLDPQDFANFAIAAARRYPQVKQWQVWGEPSAHTHFEGLPPEKPNTKNTGKKLTAEQAGFVQRYAILLDTTYAAIKSVDPNNEVIGGNTYAHSDIRPLTWVKYLRLPNGKPPRMDLYGHNPFSFRKPDLDNPPSGGGIVQVDDLPQLKSYIRKYLGKGIDLWLDEYLLPTKKNDFYFNYYISERAQASWLKAAMKICREIGGVRAFGYAQYQDQPQLNTYSGLVRADGRRKPAYATFRRG